MGMWYRESDSKDVGGAGAKVEEDSDRNVFLGGASADGKAEIWGARQDFASQRRNMGLSSNFHTAEPPPTEMDNFGYWMGSMNVENFALNSIHLILESSVQMLMALAEEATHAFLVQHFVSH